MQDKDRYRISKDIREDEDVVEFGFIEKYYHKFDIQDAKAGDVLVNQDGEMPFIFKECKDNHVYCFCGYTNRKDVFFDKFVDSAEWQKQKMMKEAVETEVIGIKKSILSGSYGCVEIKGDYKIGDRVNILTLREN